jgi:DNA adenine methylase
MKINMKKGKAFNIVPYFGGKTAHVNWLKSMFPKKRHFIDAMCGSVSVAINVNFDLITINDLNNDVINFFKVLVNNMDEFMDRLYLTPFSRKVFEGSESFFDMESDVDRSVHFYVRALQGFGGVSTQNKHNGWGCDITPGKSNHFRVDSWNTKPNCLVQLIEKLRSFQVENMDVFDLIVKFDKPTNFIYVDPPYLRSVRNDNKRYTHEWEECDHIRFLERANDVKCNMAISGYDSELYQSIIGDKFIKVFAKSSRVNTKNILRQECLWMNYQPPALNQMLF